MTCLAVFFVVTLRWTGVFGLYFSQGKVKIPLPDAGQIGDELYQPSVLFDRGDDPTTGLEFSLDPSARHLSVDRNGTIHLQKPFDPDVNNVTSTLLVWAKISSGSSKTAPASLEAQFLRMTYEPSCDNLGEDLCFGPPSLVNYTYQVYENSPEEVLGQIRPLPLQSSCDHVRTRFLVTPNDTFSVRNGILMTKGGLDREKTPEVKFKIHCYVSNVYKSGENEYVRDGILNVLDEDDNPPTLQEDEPLVAHIIKKDLHEGYTIHLDKAIILDADSVRANRYTFHVADEKPLFVPNVTVFEHDNRTIIHVRLRVTKEGEFRELPLTAMVVARDEALIHGFGGPEVNFTVTIQEYIPGTQPPPEIPSEAQRLSVSPWARHRRRVGQPFPNSSGGRFRMAASNKTVPFEITPSEGILYVTQPSMLLKAYSTGGFTTPLEFKVQWQLEKGKDGVSFLRNKKWETRTVEVMFQDDGKVYKCESPATMCAVKRLRSDCEQLCGVGVPGRCQWRDGKGSLLTDMYATCSSGLDSCPDGRCDELERMTPELCPQDCVHEGEVQGLVQFHRVPGNQPQGIKEGHGVCSCQLPDQCMCKPLDDDIGAQPVAARRGLSGSSASSLTPRTESPTQRSSSRRVHEGPSDSNALNAPDRAEPAVVPACGTGCVIFIALASMVSAAGVAGVVIFWGYRRKGKWGSAGPKHVVSATSLSGNNPDYMEDRSSSAGSQLGPPTVVTTTTPSEAPGVPASDLLAPEEVKWEFPRSRLLLEEPLGEGEFGRVLRARAQGIGGHQGEVTVAVKALKGGSGKDFLAEFRLLREVQHPHVIRLLGVCTKGGAPLLILEFAQLGSLRTYLRKCRRLESDPMAVAHNSGPHVTPADLLSFAWQISKGMSYLADMKLVHRDLAARNVLLTADRLCKISDFGMTRDVYEDDAYFKRSKGLVPVKWLAPESLADQVYTSQSDMWSFGVLLWELATLGASPYPGVAAEQLYGLLRAGYRMPRPEGCAPELYEVILRCWAEEPSRRPLFRTLTSSLEALLQAGVDYLDLGPFAAHNPGYDLAQVVPTPTVQVMSPETRWPPPSLSGGYENASPASPMTPLTPMSPSSPLPPEDGADEVRCLLPREEESPEEEEATATESSTGKDCLLDVTTR